ncbi:hypothetical protein N0P26_002609 [Acinetobacter baumannii]|uniref:Uncharacterized protein n=1 Tax=Acinetobacter baumannii TaxID=470 RepID=A0A9P2P7Z8_ACIBA|nr:hypothetical protein [Acinetobacter baumannii]EKT7959358.1 hypothetical protein [Acinetobacter baumannii]EKT9123176.1 hypothetical protein [Acinetobacter baumannii]EKT9271962.1 hypothetical protein [Acinetobacter baumannii]EKT9315295.1 hypothetical protein [Acinetobacter baumannii]EKU0107239.1 hypothetical protein [Acinetobacter baumannii]
MELFKPEKRLMNHPIHFGENPLVILSNFSDSALKQCWSQAEVETVISEASQGDYMKLIRTLRTYTLL